MTTIITPTTALRLAFGAAEPMPPESITEADIATAEARYIAPATGRKLYAALLEGRHESFTEEYLAAPAALFARLVAQPRLAIKTAATGAVAPRSSHHQAADQASQRALERSLRSEARTLLRRAVDYLNTHPADFPEYDSGESVFNRCTIHGDFIQSR